MFKGSLKKQLMQALPAWVILLVIILIASVFSENFATYVNIKNVISQASTLAVASIGQTVVLLQGGIDLSIGSTISLSTVILAQVSSIGSFGIPLAVITLLLAGALVGLINGIGVTRFRIPPMIITLSTGSLVKGIALLIQPKPGGKISLQLLDILTAKAGVFNTSSIMAIALYLLIFLTLHYTRYGRQVYAVGNNPLHARQSGVPANRVIISAYMISGIFAAVAGMVLAMRVFSGDPLIGDTYSMDSVAAAVVGGVSLAGGAGTVIGSLAGALVLSIISNVMNMLKVFAYYQYIIKGAILVLALLVFRMKRRSGINV